MGEYNPSLLAAATCNAIEHTEEESPFFPGITTTTTTKEMFQEALSCCTF